jgi:hypothetical protein
LVAQVGLLYPVKAIEKESGLITTEFVSLPAGYNNVNQTQWILSPEGFLTTWDGLRMNLSILANEVEPGKTQVTIHTHFEAFENNVSKSWIVCQSNGSLENQILDKVASGLVSVEVKTPRRTYSAFLPPRCCAAARLLGINSISPRLTRSKRARLPATRSFS